VSLADGVTDGRAEQGHLAHARGVLRRRWPVVVATLLACIAVACVHHATTTPTYRATATVAFSASTLSQAALQVNLATADPEREAATNVLIVRSPAVAAGVRQELGARESVSALLDRVDAEAAANANVLRISATAAQPADAARLANAFAQQYIAFQRQSEVQSIDEAERDLRSQLAALPADARQRPNLEDSLQRLAELRALAGGQTRVIGEAIPPGAPTGLGLAPLIAIAVVIGLAIAAVLVFLLESVDQRVTSIEQFEREYGLRALTAIPRSAFTVPRPHSRAAALEPYRMLRSGLDVIAGTRRLKTILVTSAVPGEGKTTVAVDLAHAMGLTGRRVILVELDLRRPTFAQHLPVDPRRGLTSALIQDEPVRDLLVQPFDELPNVSVLPSGRLIPNPAEVLASRQLAEVLAQLAVDDALLILDAPPLNPVADTQELLNATIVDAPLIVCRIGVATREQVRRARAILERHLARPVGLVVTGLTDPAYHGYGDYASHGEVDRGPVKVHSEPVAARRARQ
jgi:capsular exopolysaccharide synthesis family protein